MAYFMAWPVIPGFGIALSWGLPWPGEEVPAFPRDPSSPLTPSSCERSSAPTPLCCRPVCLGHVGADHGTPCHRAPDSFRILGVLSCVLPLVPVHPLHRELGRGRGAPRSTPSPIQMGTQGPGGRWGSPRLQLGPEARRPVPRHTGLSPHAFLSPPASHPCLPSPFPSPLVVLIYASMLLYVTHLLAKWSRPLTLLGDHSDDLWGG